MGEVLANQIKLHDWAIVVVGTQGRGFWSATDLGEADLGVFARLFKRPPSGLSQLPVGGARAGHYLEFRPRPGGGIFGEGRC
jgi:hypothetical protein